MHAIATLEKRGERSIWEVVLHLQQMDQFWHSAAFFDDLFEVDVGVADKLVNRFLISKDTVLIRLLVLEHTKVGFTGHQEALLNDVNEAEAKEIQWNVHEIGCR